MDPIAPKRVRKRKRRGGPKRALNLLLTNEWATWTDVEAAKGLTDPAEIVMDALELLRSHLHRQRRQRGGGEPAAGDDGGDSAAAA